MLVKDVEAVAGDNYRVNVTQSAGDQKAHLRFEEKIPIDIGVTCNSGRITRSLGKLSEKMWGRAIKVISSTSELQGDGVMYTLTKALMPRTCGCIEPCCNDPSVCA